jgi:hypothetical protein
MKSKTMRASACKTPMSLTIGAALAFAAPAYAHEPTPVETYSSPGGTATSDTKSGTLRPIRADSHAPIGVMADHMHKKGEWMFSYRFMHMGMDGNLIGTNGVSPSQIAATVPNTNPVVTPAGATAVPPTMRIVPTQMPMDMHMIGAMYAPTDNLTLMVMLPVVSKDMTHLTYAPTPPRNTNIVGGFTTVSGGVGDVSLSGMFRLYDAVTEDSVNHVHLNMGVSFPTGSIGQTGSIFDPFGRRPTIQLPYAMQIGTGTYDLLPGITYTGRFRDFSWGAQYRADLRLGRNQSGYAWGNKQMVTGWVAYEFAPWISTSFRAQYTAQGAIKGFDPLIGGPVQTAYPQNYGGEKIELFGGMNFVGQTGLLRNQRIAFEIGAPVYQRLNGPQLQTSWTATLGWQYSF